MQNFLKKLNAKTGKQYRLPTEAEWEYAARGGSKSQGYIFAGSNDLSDVAWNTENRPSAQTQPVGTRKANELGIYDMSGNVYEWCETHYSPYADCAQPGAPTGERICRGGAWFSNRLSCRVAFRGKFLPTVRNNYIGFRLARSK